MGASADNSTTKGSCVKNAKAASPGTAHGFEPPPTLLRDTITPIDSFPSTHRPLTFNVYGLETPQLAGRRGVHPKAPDPGMRHGDSRPH